MHTIKTKIKCQAARTGISPTNWPRCEKKKTQTHNTKPYHMARVDRDYLRIMMSSPLLPFYSLQSGILNMQYSCNIIIIITLWVPGCQAPPPQLGPALHTKRKLYLTSYTFTPNLIMGQVFYVLTRDPRDPFTFCRPI